MDVEAARLTAGTTNRWGFRLASAGFLAWVIFLAYEVIVSANPIVLSRQQILSAPVIVEGTLLSNPNRIRARRVWWGSELFDPANEIALQGPVTPAATDANGSYIIPLGIAGHDRWRVFAIPTESYLRVPGPLERVYPANPAVRRQLESLLMVRRSFRNAEQTGE